MTTHETSPATPAAPTPGPWHIEVAPNGKPFVTNEQRQHVCTLYEHGDPKAIAANARVIAAAPNLLALAEEYRDACSERISLLKEDLADEHGFSGDASDIRDQIEHWKAVRKNCNAVISKARGNAA